VKVQSLAHVFLTFCISYRMNKPGYKHCFSMLCGAPAGTGLEVVVGAAPPKPVCPKCAVENDVGYAFCKGCGERPATDSAPSSPRPDDRKEGAESVTTLCGE
jgi:hypothetical protein